jgi:hypothetical protein
MVEPNTGHPLEEKQTVGMTEDLPKIATRQGLDGRYLKQKPLYV